MRWDTADSLAIADPTRTSTLTEDDGRAPRRWWIELVHHDNPTHISRRIALDGPVSLGRKSDTFGDGVLDDGHISRAHAEFDQGSAGTPIVRDVGSRNGTYVNGSRIQEHPLVAGDVIGLGRALLMVTRDPQPPDVHAPQGMVGTSYAFLSTVATVAKASTRGPTLLWGESGVGKNALAQHLHAVSGRTGPLEVTRCGPSQDEETLLRAVLEAASGGTVVLGNVEELPAAAQLLLVDALDGPELQGTGVVACTVESPDGLAQRLRPELLHRLRRWSIRVPSLTERRTDIPHLALAFARRYCSDEARLDAELTFRLLRHRWPGNLHELEALVERAAVEADGDRLAPFEGLDALLAQRSSAAGISTYGRKVEREPFVADATGRWYSAPDGQRFDLQRRKTLARVLATMLEARRDEPGRALSVTDMLERAWPDEKLLPRAGANRVYVAMTTLRKMGLRDLLVRTDSGYVLDPDVPLRIVEA
ncbi:MAG: FHA domain-containing protein [Nannocystaceae bacterium]|nr:FHA domain-containing protein [Nannocystaceae bacterium]